MGKKRARKARRAKDRPPKTIGDLRRLLSRRGNPWLPDASLSDDEPIPVFPTGGDRTREPPGRLLPEGGVIDFIKATPPTNPSLRAVWKRRGLLDTSVRPEARSGKPRRPDGDG